MLKNTNQAAVRKLSARSLRQNRVRNIFVILAIILTTFMFTTVFSIGFSLGKNMNTMMLRQQGTKRSIWLEHPGEEQIAQAKKAEHLHAAGIQIPTGVATDRSEKSTIRLDYYDSTEFEQNLSPAISDLQGAYPKQENEIMLSQAALEALKLKHPKRGMEISLKTETGSQTFRLSGWFTDYTSTFGGFQGLVSEAYAKAAGKTVEQDGILSLSAKNGEKQALLQELDALLKYKKGQELDFTWDVQEENKGNGFIIAATIGIMGIIIVVSGYLLIYNIMYISVTRDIRFYGMLKTIGTTPSQIRKIVRDQIRRLSVVGIPVGLLLGSILAFQAVPIALSVFTMDENGAMPGYVSFHPFIYLGTILFAMVTVAVSCRKPAKLAGRVSAVEALKFRGQMGGGKRKRKSTDGGKLYKMSFRNVFREKKRAFLVFASLFMGTMAFLAVNTFLGSMKLENYIAHYLPNDFTIHMASDPEEIEETDQNYGQSVNRLIEDLNKIEGITTCNVNHSAYLALEFDADVYRPFLERDVRNGTTLQDLTDAYTKNANDKEGIYSAPVIAISSSMAKKYNEKASQKIDIKRFEKGELCIIGNALERTEAEEIRGKKITLKDLETGKTLTQEVGCCPMYDEENLLNFGVSWQIGGGPSYVLLSEKAMEKIYDHPWVNSIVIDCDSKKENQVKSRIKSLTRGNSYVQHTEIKSDISAEFLSSMMAMNILGSGISIVLILIGVINFINVMFTGVFARRGELAVMESVGMTKKQIRKMLIYEGAYYAGITILLLFTLGSGIIYLIAHMACQIADYAVFYYPIGWMGILSAIILVICMSVPAVVYHAFAKESVTERLRKED